ncbi:hypothetical protein Tco_1554116 [Tanacetum coccineum]
MEARYGKFLDMIRAVQINVPLVNVLAGIPNYGKFLKELVSNKHKLEHISAAFLSDESSAIIQNKVQPKLGDPGSFLIPCNFNKAFSCNALADLAKNMLVEVGKFIFLVDFVILEMEEDKPLSDLELKPLPDNLEYVFLEEPSFLLVIISSQFSKQNKSKLISVLKRHKQAFAWKTTDILGICPSFCKHKIQLLDDKKPIVQKQRILNPNMQEVVKKEIVKLLDTGIIYPIADSPWVSPIHCVPKKGDITIVTNKKDELVPTRTVTGWRNQYKCSWTTSPSLEALLINVSAILIKCFNVAKMQILSLIGKNVTLWLKKELCLDTKCPEQALKLTKAKST